MSISYYILYMEQLEIYIFNKIKRYINSFESFFEIPLGKLNFFPCFAVYGFVFLQFLSFLASFISITFDQLSKCFQHLLLCYGRPCSKVSWKRAHHTLVPQLDSLFLFSAGQILQFVKLLPHLLAHSFVYNIFFFFEPFSGVFITSST